jgi:hypothetical protein
MAKFVNKKRHETGRTITTPSAYGSHASMVVDHEDYGLELEEGMVLCEDDSGFYITKRSRLDDGLADPNRYSVEKFQLVKPEAQESQ